MTTPRNEPCPCGSGKKYKRCCLAVDEAVPPALRLIRNSTGVDPRTIDLRGVDVSPEWEVDLVPAAIAIGDTPDARPTIAMVCGGDAVLHVDVLGRSPAEIPDIAAILISAIDAAMTAAARTPSLVTVRHESLAAEMRPALQSRGIEVSADATLPEVDAAVDSLERDIFGAAIEPGQPHVSRPQTWSAWGAPAALIGRLFAAAATFIRAAPWERLLNDDVLLVTAPSGTTWAVCVLGAAGEEYGFALYESAEDLRDLLTGKEADPGMHFVSLRAGVISLLFDDRDHTPPAMRREIRAARWELETASSYPVLLPMNTPGGGITRQQLEDLVAIVRAVTGFVRAYPDPFEHWGADATELRWTDASSNTTIRYDGPWDTLPEPLWTVPDVLSRCGADGPNAMHGFTYPAGVDLVDVADVEFGMVDRFEEWLQAPGGRYAAVSAATARKHARVASMLVEHMVFGERVPLGAVTELDLRLFAYDRYPLLRSETSTQQRAMLGSLGRFFEYLASYEGISCPWSGAIICDRDAFLGRLETVPGAPRSEELIVPWALELMMDLDARCFLPGPSNDIEIDDAAAFVLGEDEQALGRGWLVWRDEEIAAGCTDPAELKDRLLARQAARGSRRR